MFENFKKKKIIRAIISVSYDKIETYKQAFRNVFNMNLGKNEDISEKTCNEIRANYLNLVSDTVLKVFRETSFNLHLQIIFENPYICGLVEEQLNPKTGIMAGNLFKLVYYLMTQKIAKDFEVFQLNHYQNGIMDQALSDLDKELG